MSSSGRSAASSTVLAQFADRLVHELRIVPLPADLAGEGDLERRILIPAAVRARASGPAVRLAVHPFRNKRRCQPDCERAGPHRGSVVLGCPQCWRNSKLRWPVAAFGSHHTFDLVASHGEERLALEAKLVSAQGGRMPNGEIQRFFGQCALAASKHPHVIGVLISRGPLRAKYDADTVATEAWFARLGVQLVIREAPVAGAVRPAKRPRTPSAGR